MIMQDQSPWCRSDPSNRGCVFSPSRLKLASKRIGFSGCRRQKRWADPLVLEAAVLSGENSGLEGERATSRMQQPGGSCFNKSRPRIKGDFEKACQPPISASKNMVADDPMIHHCMPRPLRHSLATRDLPWKRMSQGMILLPMVWVESWAQYGICKESPPIT